MPLLLIGYSLFKLANLAIQPINCLPQTGNDTLMPLVIFLVRRFLIGKLATCGSMLRLLCLKLLLKQLLLVLELLLLLFQLLIETIRKPPQLILIIQLRLCERLILAIPQGLQLINLLPDQLFP